MAVWVGLFGLIVGSFLNVVIARLPKGESLVSPRSHCVRCGKALSPVELIPVVSWMVQRGRCRHCGAWISLQYPLVELANAFLWLAVWDQYGASVEAGVYALLMSFLVALSAIDLQTQLLPNKLTLPGMVVGLAGRWLIVGSPLDSVIGSALGLGIITIIVIVSRGGMGLGDAKLMAMLGAFLGWRQSMAALVVGAVLGGIVGVVLLVAKIKGRKDMIPYGPFLAAGAVLVVLAKPFVRILISWV